VAPERLLGHRGSERPTESVEPLQLRQRFCVRLRVALSEPWGDELFEQ
jgi:hypothetical protein